MDLKKICFLFVKEGNFERQSDASTEMYDLYDWNRLINMIYLELTGFKGTAHVISSNLSFLD